MFSGEILMFLLFLFIVCVYQVNYGNFMHGLMKENIQLNRKVLPELSMHEQYSFKALENSKLFCKVFQCIPWKQECGTSS